MEILTRLPVKSLLRFSCVSKSWLSLISSPYFTKTHLENRISNKSYTHHRLFCITAIPKSHFTEFPLTFLQRDQAAAAPAPSDHAFPNPDMPMWIVGSCRGIVCISLDDVNLVLWNPSTGKHRRLPYLNNSPKSGCYMKDGFGYDELNNDYKVVAILFGIFQKGPYKVLIFSLKANRWKRIEDFKHGVPLDNSAKYTNGKLHWLVKRDGRMNIVSLDLASEQYGKLGPPRNADNGNSCSAGLFSESLCLMLDDHKASMHVWVMKEYGVRDSWARVLVIPHIGGPGRYPHMLRVWSLNNDEILLSYGRVVVVYDMKGNTYRYPPIDNIHAIIQADVYVESLVSPSG
ncbi:F-box/kelch-repeat protein at3g06240 [Phtheirospermum japonicum]|uniref:F-box/kelch-repeat protein at3g06240 n=1 Tax=Phtheirospermum japonicum TaxID=374723 RepID=A0A830CEX9_9LAMI|nr:F-box/kelch-repeat protein at3g06240 [Phtheirospermum japonicum]